jgi:hypothetical protein
MRTKSLVCMDGATVACGESKRRQVSLHRADGLTSVALAVDIRPCVLLSFRTSVSIWPYRCRELLVGQRGV